jgi:phosphoribosylamine--glycine ligase
MSETIRVLVVGGGAREHAICDAIKRSKQATLFVVMKNNNPGIARLAADVLIEKETNTAKVVQYAQHHQIDIVCIGPEAPLQQGLADALTKQGIAVCAPTKEAARIETDKEWMRNLLKKHNIPGQLQFNTFTNPQDARAFIESLEGKVALKPIGLTGGKGVWVQGDHFTTIGEAMTYANKVISESIGGAAKILVEEKAVGEEFTVQGFSDGTHLVTLPAVQDHKRLLPDDKGPNTGGMGSYSYANGLLPFLTENDYTTGVDILKHIIHALNKEGCPYVGPIYGQFMVGPKGVKVIEINARFGDPENMNVLPLLQTDYIQLCQAMIEGTIDTIKLEVQKKATVCKYVVPEGYGFQSVADTPIMVNEQAIADTGALLFYASVNKQNSAIRTTSSRSLAVVGVADTIEQAEYMCEQALSHVQGDHIFIRHDIGTPLLIQKRIEHMNTLRGTT